MENVDDKTFLIIFLEIDLRIKVINIKSVELNEHMGNFSPTDRVFIFLPLHVLHLILYCVEEVVK